MPGYSQTMSGYPQTMSGYPQTMPVHVHPPIISVLRDPHGHSAPNNIDTDTLVELQTESAYNRIYFTTDGSKPDPFQPHYGRSNTFKYKGPFTLKPGKRTIRTLATSSDGAQESSVVTKSFMVENKADFDQDRDYQDDDIYEFIKPRRDRSRDEFDAEDDVSSISTSECTIDDDIKHWQQKKKDLERDVENMKYKQKRDGEKEKIRKEKEKELDEKKAKVKALKDQKKSLKDGKDKKYDKKDDKNDDKDKEKEKDEKKKKKEKKREEEKKDSEKDSGEEGLELVPSTNKRVMPKEAWGAGGALAGSHDVDGPFNPTNYSGTQINLWGIPPDQWPTMTVGPRGTEFIPAPPKPPMPEAMRNPGVSVQQLGAITNQVMDKLDETHKTTVRDVRKAIEESKNAQPPPPPPAPAPAPKPTNGNGPILMPVSAGDGDVKKQVGHVYAHLLDFAKKDADFRAAIASPKMGKLISADFDEGDDSYLITIQLSKPGGKKPAPPPVVKKPPVKKSPAVKKPPPKPEPAPAPEPEPEPEPPKEEVPFFETEEYEQEGTLKPAPNFDAEADAEKLRKAMKGLGTDEKAIIDVLGHRSCTQRLDIVKTFKTAYGKDLIKELKSEISSHFLDACTALCTPPDHYDANELRKSMKGLGTDEDVLIEIVCTRTNAQIAAVKEAYKSVHNRDLEKDIESETSGHFKRILISLIQANRDESQEFDRNKAKQDAQKLHEAGEKKFGTDESVFNQILASRSYPHLRAVFEEYEKLDGKDMEKVIESEMSGDLKKAMVTIVRCIKYKPDYFAKALQKSMKGLGTDDNTLVRIIVSRCESDMVQIKSEFEKQFKGGSLGKWLQDDLSGDYMKLMCALIGETVKK